MVALGVSYGFGAFLNGVFCLSADWGAVEIVAFAEFSD